jgi:hypothetical protein
MFRVPSLTNRKQHVAGWTIRVSTNERVAFVMLVGPEVVYMVSGARQ